MTVTKQDSNVTGARYAEEASIKTLPGSPVWYPLEPNSYKNFGATSKLVARNPINPTRQRKKGVITDLDATGGWNQDLTMNNLTRLLQGFFFANVREQVTNLPMNGTAKLCTGVTTAPNKYTFAAAPAFLAGALLMAAGFGKAANNGLMNVTAITGTDVTVSQTLANEASPPATAKLTQVGVQGTAGDLALTYSGGTPGLSSTALDFTTYNLLEGQWVYIGGDTVGTKFASGQGGLARIAVGGVAAHSLTFDKIDWTAPAADAGTGKTIQVFIPMLLRNEPNPTDIVHRSYQIERTLGDDDVGTQSQYLVGAVASQLSLNIPQADKVNVDLTFVACDDEQRTGTDGLKTGSRPSLAPESAVNTSSDLKRVNLSLLSAGAAPSPLFAYAQDITLTINNNIDPNKALAVLGAFNLSAGQMDIDGKMTVYFADVTAVQAVRGNADVTLDFFMVKDGVGQVWDMPLIALGNGLPDVQANKPITLPLDTNAAESAFGYTLALCQFPYLPAAAAV